MHKNITLAAIIVLAAAGTARAGGKEGTIGVGAEFGLNGKTGGGSVNYDAGKFHFGGFLGFLDGPDDDDTDYTFGARFYYHIHESTMSDFGIGGGLGYFSTDDRGMIGAERSTELYFEPGIQIRAFISNNVALSFTAGLTFGLSDANGAALGGQFNALGGVHYYFFK